MVPLLATKDRMIDQSGRPLEWRGKWRYADLDPQIVYILPPLLPATYPRGYYHR